MKVCRKHNLHLISDEIYGLSTWNNPQMEQAVGFTSVLSLEVEKFMDPSMVHVVWGMSKVRNETHSLWLTASKHIFAHFNLHRTLAQQACGSAV